MSLLADLRRGRYARQQEEEENAQNLARQVITYLDKQLNGGTSKYIDAHKFHREFPDINDKIKVTKKGKIKITKIGYFFDCQK